MSSSSIDLGLETLLINADRTVLRNLSPFARCTILLLRFLRTNSADYDTIVAFLEGYGVRCKNLNRVLDKLVKMGVVKRDQDGFVLTSYGMEVSYALHDIVDGIRLFAYSVLDGRFSVDDVTAEVMTPTASSIGLVEAYVEDPTMWQLYLILHMYVSGLSSAVLSLLASVNAFLLESLRKVVQG